MLTAPLCNSTAVAAAAAVAARRCGLYVGAPGVLGAERAGAVARVCRAQQQQQQQQQQQRREK